MKTMKIRLKRAYDDPENDDGFRVLVDRVWPRGRSKADLLLDAWCKEIAPSTELRQWFGHNPEKWIEFKRRYVSELEKNQEQVEELLRRGEGGRITLIYAARDKEHNNAVVLMKYLQLRQID
jgi:uncharacterized protein YeaO (DUF488 family)